MSILDLALRAVPHASEQALPVHDWQAADLREHFEERAAIMEHDGLLPRDVAEREAARMTATLARNRGYQWQALRAALAGVPSIQAMIPDRPGQVDALPLGVAKLAIIPGRRVIRQGAHHE